MKEYIVTVMARDRVGIVRDVSTALADIGGNVTHVSQTVMRCYFTLIMSVQLPDERAEHEIRQAIERKGEIGELVVNVRPFVEKTESEDTPCERFVLTLRGTDRPGIISLATNYLADRGINIDDFFAYILDGRFVMLVKVSIPLGTDADEVRTELEKLGREQELIVHLQHENIFRATSDVRPVVEL